MRKRIILWSLALLLLTVGRQDMLAQQSTASNEPAAQSVSYTLGKTMKNDVKSVFPRLHSRQHSQRLLKEQKNGAQNLLQKQAPIQITSQQLKKAVKAAKVKAKAPYTPDNSHKHLIVNVIYNSLDEEMDEGLFDLDVETGELTLLFGNFIEDYENYGFNGGGYVWNGKYRGVFYDDEFTVSNGHQATIMEFDMNTWEMTDIFDIPYMSSMALECGTQFNADGTTTVMGQYWGVDSEGNLTLRYATLDADGKATTSFGKGASKHMMAMGVTNDGRLYGVAKDGNLYQVDRTTGEEILVGHTGITDVVDYEGGFWYQSGEIDPLDNTFYWMAEHASVYWSQLCTVDLQTGKATPLIDFAGDVQCVGMVIAPQQRKNDTPAAVTGLTASFGPLETSGSGSFVAPSTTFSGQQLSADATLYYHLYVNNEKQTVSNNPVKPGATVNFTISDANIQRNSMNAIRVTVSAAEDGEESVSASTTAWQGYGIAQAPKSAAMTFDEQTSLCTITWEAPAKGADAGVQGGYVDKVCYNVYRLVDGERTGLIANGLSLADDVHSATYTLTDEDLNMTLGDLSFGVEAVTAPWGVPQASLVSEETATNAISVGKGKETPYFVDIANDYYKVNQKDFTIINANNDKNAWVWCPPHYTGGQSLSGAVACPNYSGTLPMDDWFITPGIALVAGKTYHFKSYVHGPGAGVPWYEFAEVRMGTNRTAEAMTTTIIERTMIEDYLYLETDFTVPEDGNYYFGVHSISDADNWEIALFDIFVGENTEAPVDKDAPAAGEMAVTPVYGITQATDANNKTVYYGAADIQVTLPTEKMDGTALADSELLDVKVTATSGTTTQTIAEYSAQAKGTVLTLKAENLPSGEYTFNLQTTLPNHQSPLTTQTAYVGWDNAVAIPTGMTCITSGDKLYVQFPEIEQPKGANGAYLPSFSYRAYGGSKAAQLTYYAQQGYDYIYDMIDADAVSANNRITAPDFNPQEGQQYLWLWYVLSVSKDANGKNIYSQLTPVRTIVGQPVQAPAIETGAREFIIDADVSPELSEVWNYYLSRGEVVCGVTPIEDQFGSDFGSSWNIFSAFNGDLLTYFSKVDISTQDNPVFAFDIIMEDPETDMEVVFNGPEGKQAVHKLTVMDGVQNICIPLEQYKSWGWVQPTLKSTFHIATEGDRIHDIYVDNAGVYNQLPVNLAVAAVETTAEMKSGEEAIVNVTIMNMGQQAAKNYTVALTEDETLVESKTFARALQPGETTVVQFDYRANTVYAFDKVGQEEAEKVLIATVEVENDANEDDNSAEAVVTISVTGGKKNSYPSNVVAQTAGNDAVNITWDFNFDQTEQVVTESFEDYETWTTGGVKAGGPKGQIGPWKLYDGDNMPTYTWVGFDNIINNSGAPHAFQVYEGALFAYSDKYYYLDMEAVTGDKFLATMDPADGNYTPLPDDWIISPRVAGGTALEFYYSSLSSKLQGAELLYSETGQDISDFKLLTTLENVSSLEWQFAYAKLPATAKYFAIHHNKSTHLGYGLRIDDITYSVITAIDHFNIYVDGHLVGTSTKADYTFTGNMEEGEHQIAVTAVYADGTESIPAYATFDYSSAISDILMSGRPFNVYTLDGKLVRSNARSIEGLKGVYVIEGKNVILK